MPSDIQNARVTAALVERYGIKGRFRPRMDETVVPVHVLAIEEASGIEGTGYQSSRAEAAVVGEQAVCRFRGGTGGSLSLPKRVTVYSPGGGANIEIWVRFNDSAVSSVLTGAVNFSGEDRWNVGRPGAAARLQFGTFPGAVTTTSIVGRYLVPQNEQITIDLSGWRLPDDVELNLEAETANQAVTWTVVWDDDFPG